jgi:hypothetical protein
MAGRQEFMAAREIIRANGRAPLGKPVIHPGTIRKREPPHHHDGDHIGPPANGSGGASPCLVL